uniref:Uncharacterized protein n=1 Tax=Arundo donax TaxID=35708 RepID=A0A0A9EL80_ARUDO
MCLSCTLGVRRVPGCVLFKSNWVSAHSSSILQLDALLKLNRPIF